MSLFIPHREFLGPHRALEGELSEFLLAYVMHAKPNSSSFPQNSLSSLFWNSTRYAAAPLQKNYLHKQILRNCLRGDCNKFTQSITRRISWELFFSEATKIARDGRVCGLCRPQLQRITPGDLFSLWLRIFAVVTPKQLKIMLGNLLSQCFRLGVYHPHKKYRTEKMLSVFIQFHECVTWPEKIFSDFDFPCTSVFSGWNPGIIPVKTNYMTWKMFENWFPVRSEITWKTVWKFIWK